MEHVLNFISIYHTDSVHNVREFFKIRLRCATGSYIPHPSPHIQSLFGFYSMMSCCNGLLSDPLGGSLSAIFRNRGNALSGPGACIFAYLQHVLWQSVHLRCSDTECAHVCSLRPPRMPLHKQIISRLPFYCHWSLSPVLSVQSTTFHPFTLKHI